jgi:hypothetical protein
MMGNIGYDGSGVLAPNLYDFSFVSTESSMALYLILRGAKCPASPSFSGRNIARAGNVCGEGIYCEDWQQTLGAAVTFATSGDIIRNTTTVRVGGAATSLECVPQSNTSTYAPLLVAEWTEVAVPASAQTKSIYVKGEGWSSYPTAAELYLEAEYISNGTTFARTIVTSTEVIDENTNWHSLSVTFTPAVAGQVRYRVFLKKYAASCKVYVDNALYTA